MIVGFSFVWYVLVNEGSKRFDPTVDVDSAMDLLEESSFVSVFVVFASCGVMAPETVWELLSRSADSGRFLLPIFHVDFTLARVSLVPLSGASLGGSGGEETESSAMGAGWLSDPSPMTAISPDSSGVGSPFLPGESLDQNAHVEPALGVGVLTCACVGSGMVCGAVAGGASSGATSSEIVCCSASLDLLASAVAVSVRGAFEAHRPNHDVEAGSSGC